jgi:hypothetical protein
MDWMAGSSPAMTQESPAMTLFRSSWPAFEPAIQKGRQEGTG